MKRFILLLSLLLCPLPLNASDPVVVPMDGVTAVEPSASPVARVRVTRTERKLAREVIADAADACGMRRLEFLRAVDRGDTEAHDELRLSLVAHDAVGEVDIDRLHEILQMILDFISQLLAMFGMFSDATALDALDLWCVNVGFDLLAA